MWASLENYDVQLGPATPCLGGSTHPCCIATDDDQSFFGHDSSSRTIYYLKHQVNYNPLQAIGNFLKARTRTNYAVQ